MAGGFDFGGFDLDLDFDLGDFDLVQKGEPREQPLVRIMRPRMDLDDIGRYAAFENAEVFARQLDLTPGARTFAWVDGSFIFGDVVEALITERRVGVKRLYITSLSFSEENIDSLKNVMTIMGDELEKIVLVLSGYQYSHEKYRLVPYMYQELDDGTNRFQCAFGGWHCKIITLETVLGHTITIHGSANLRSSNSIEQVMAEVDNRDLHDFNARIMDDIAARFGTINHDAPYHRMRRIENKEAWEVSTQWQADPEADAAATAAATEEADGG